MKKLSEVEQPVIEMIIQGAPITLKFSNTPTESLKDQILDDLFKTIEIQIMDVINEAEI